MGQITIAPSLEDTVTSTALLLLNEHQGISAEMALRLSKAFDTTPELWMNMQRNYDLWNAEQKVPVKEIKIFRRIKAAPAETIVLKGKGTRLMNSHT